MDGSSPKLRGCGIAGSAGSVLDSCKVGRPEKASAHASSESSEEKGSSKSARNRIIRYPSPSVRSGGSSPSLQRRPVGCSQYQSLVLSYQKYQQVNMARIQGDLLWVNT